LFYGVPVSLHQKDVPHGRYLDVDFANGGAATIVLDQGSALCAACSAAQKFMTQ
jgi:hypothetical protein